MPKKSLFIFLYVFLGSANSISAYHSKEPVDKKNPVRVQTTEMEILPWDPNASISTQWIFNSALFKGLVSFDSHFKIEPGIFLNWTWNEKDKYYEITVDPKVMYHNGQYLKIEDIEFAIAKLFIGNVNIVRKELISDIVGLEKLKRGQSFKSGMITGLKRKDGNKLLIYLKKRNPYFLYTLSTIVPGVSPADSFQKDMFTYKKLPIGTGNYKVASIDKDKVKVLVQRINRVENTSASGPDFIEFIEKGDPVENKIDIAANIAAHSLSKSKEYTIVHSPIPASVVTVDFNYASEHGKNKIFRKIISLALDRNEIWKNYAHIKAAHELVPQHLIGQTKVKFEYNRELAKKLVKENFGQIQTIAWFHGQKNEEPSPFIIQIAKQLSEVGIKVTFRPTLKQYFSEKDNNISMYTFATSSSFSDPTLIFSLYIDSKNRQFHFPKDDGHSKSLLQNFRSVESTKEKHDILRQLSANFANDIRQIPIGQKFQIFALSKRVKSINHSKLSFKLDFENIEMAK